MHYITVSRVVKHQMVNSFRIFFDGCALLWYVWMEINTIILYFIIIIYSHGCVLDWKDFCWEELQKRAICMNTEQENNRNGKSSRTVLTKVNIFAFLIEFKARRNILPFPEKQYYDMESQPYMKPFRVCILWRIIWSCLSFMITVSHRLYWVEEVILDLFQTG